LAILSKSLAFGAYDMEGEKTSLLLNFKKTCANFSLRVAFGLVVEIGKMCSIEFEKVCLNKNSNLLGMLDGQIPRNYPAFF
jgi:hypothetical protein